MSLPLQGALDEMRRRRQREQRIKMLLARMAKYEMVQCPECLSQDQPSDGKIIACGICLTVTRIEK